MTLASVVISGGMRSASVALRSAKLSTSPLSTAVRYGAGWPAISGGRSRFGRGSVASWACSSELSGWALAWEMMPTLAHRVWPRTTASAVGASNARRSRSSATMAWRSARVLSPSSPISAAALYTTRWWRSATCTAPEENRGSRLRRASSAATAPARRSSWWPRTSTCRPAESRPRTFEAVEGRQRLLDGQVAAPGAGRGLRSGQEADLAGGAHPVVLDGPDRALSPTMAALMASRSSPPSRRRASPSNESRAASMEATWSSRARARWVTSLIRAGSATRAVSAGRPRRLRSTSATAAATRSSRRGSGSPSAAPARSARAWSSAEITCPLVGAGRSDGRRTTAMIPHMDGAPS